MKLEKLFKERVEAIRKRNYKKADEIRNKIRAAGVFTYDNKVKDKNGIVIGKETHYKVGRKGEQKIFKWADHRYYDEMP